MKHNLINNWLHTEDELSRIALPYFSLPCKISGKYYPFRSFLRKSINSTDDASIDLKDGEIWSCNLQLGNSLTFESTVFKNTIVNISISKALNKTEKEKLAHFLVAEQFFFTNDLFTKIIHQYHNDYLTNTSPSIKDSKYYKDFEELWLAQFNNEEISNLYRSGINEFRYDIIRSKYWKQLILVMYYFNKKDTTFEDKFFLLSLIHKTMFLMITKLVENNLEILTKPVISLSFLTLYPNNPPVPKTLD